ncbi:hypothetical protein CRE_17881 [Caenorhabditis remanei]|uniref:F-box associated domain-containing protein n=1 Tax=Caenorhabditis remanei TaxID=31234 RepID=E3MDD0_CAERE|nr:hypothetical protein CRE_17881 [Caenorhabditis remanei]
MKKYLEGKPNIHVGYEFSSNDRFPELPTKKLELIQEESIDADHPIIHTTADVIFQFNGQNKPMNGIEKLHTKKLTILNIGYKNVDAVKIIKDWIKNGRKIGTEYLLCFTFLQWIRWVLSDLKNEFDEFENDLEGINVRFLAREPRFLIPISPISKIIIYGTEIESEDGTVYQLVLKVVSTDE